MPFPVCITGDIDDGLEDMDTIIRPLLEVLASHGVRMTFPVTAAALREHREKFVRIADAGHEIAAHGDTHRPFVGNLEEQVGRLRAMLEEFEDVLGIRPAGFRAPYLEHDPTTYRALADVGLAYDSSRICKDPLTYARSVVGETKAFPIPATRLPAIVVRYMLGRTAARPYLVAPGVVEIPVYDLDDWFFYDYSGGPKVSPNRSEAIARQWAAALRHFQRLWGSVFAVQAHPRRMARGLLRALDYFVHDARIRGCEFLTLSEMRARCWADPDWRSRNVIPPRWLQAGPIRPVIETRA